MIFFKGKSYAKVWKITPAEKYLDLRISTSEKDKEGNYVNSNWYPRCIGHAFNSLNGKLKEGDRIVITQAKLTNEAYIDKEGNKKSSFRFLITEANIEGDEHTEAESTSTEVHEEPATEEAKNEDSPW